MFRRYPNRISCRISCRIPCMRYLCRISYEDDAHTLKDILVGYLESFPAGYPAGYPVCCPAAAGKFRLGTRCSPVALHPTYRSRLRPRFCALNEAGGFSTMCVYSALPGPGPPGAARTGPQRRRSGARAAQQRRTARWHRTVPVKGGWEGVGVGGRGRGWGKGAAAKRRRQITSSP
jgi:hypothetical protein